MAGNEDMNDFTDFITPCILQFKKIIMSSIHCFQTFILISHLNCSSEIFKDLESRCLFGKYWKIYLTLCQITFLSTVFLPHFSLSYFNKTSKIINK